MLRAIVRWDDLNEKRSLMEHIFLNICFTVSAVLQVLEGTALLEEVCYWRKALTYFPVISSTLHCSWRCVLPLSSLLQTPWLLLAVMLPSHDGSMILVSLEQNTQMRSLFCKLHFDSGILHNNIKVTNTIHIIPVWKGKFTFEEDHYSTREYNDSMGLIWGVDPGRSLRSHSVTRRGMGDLWKDLFKGSGGRHVEVEPTQEKLEWYRYTNPT